VVVSGAFRAEEPHVTAHAHHHHGDDASPSTEGRVARAADRVGAIVGLLCAIHCAIVPLMLGVLPALGLGFLAGLTFELTLLGLAGVVAAVAVVHALRRGHPRAIVAGLVAGFALLVAGVLVEDQHRAHTLPAPGLDAASLHDHAHDHGEGSGEHSLPSTLLSVAGGVLLGVSHIRNSRGHRAACDGPTAERAPCSHCHDHGTSSAHGET
jgi:hypothetical protein